jgi:hypothetical protein
VTVSYAAVDGTATGFYENCTAANSAFVNESGTLTFTPGVTEQTVRVPILYCNTSSPLTFTFELSSPTNATIGGTGTATITIVNPATVPGAPTGVAAKAGDHSATVSFSPPASDGGDPVNYYTVTASPGGRTATGITSPITLTGLTDGTSYTFTVTATNAVGTGPASAPSGAVTPGLSVPGAPTNVTAVAGNAKVTLSWKAPATTGGSALSGYEIYVGTASGKESSTPVNKSPVTGTSYAVTGLTDGTTYYFIVKARNAIGLSPASNQLSAIPSPVNFVARPGTATDISVGANGSVWAVGTASVAGGHPIYRWNGSKWVTVAGGAVAIAVDQHGNPWIVNSSHKISHWSATKWIAVSGTATSIAVGANGSVWAVGTANVSGGHPVYRWNGSKWVTVADGAVAIAVDQHGNPWIVNSSHKISHWSGSKWVAVTGTATDISVGANGTVWDVGADTVPGGYSVYERIGSGWTKSSGTAVKIAVDQHGNPWIVNSSHQIFFG